MTSPTGNGRTALGRFAKGNAGGPGNPHAKRVTALREALLAAVTDADIKAVARALVARAKAGEVAAARELLDRVLGKCRHSEEQDAPAEWIVSPEIVERARAIIERRCGPRTGPYNE
jgi:hypothetical protein